MSFPLSREDLRQLGRYEDLSSEVVEQPLSCQKDIRTLRSLCLPRRLLAR